MHQLFKVKFSTLVVTESTRLNGPVSVHFRYTATALKLSVNKRFFLGGKQSHAQAIKLGLRNSLYLQNLVLNVYVKCRKFSLVDKLFDKMFERNLVTWNTVICGVVDDFFGESELRFEKGFSYFKRMLLDKVKFNALTLNVLLRGCVKVNEVEIGRQFHCLVSKFGFCLDCLVNNALIDLYGKCGCINEARSVFDEMLYRNVVTWNVMVSCYTLNCLAKTAFGVFKLMRRHNLIGDVFTFSSLLSSCVTLRSCELGRQVHGLIVKLCFDLDVLVASGLVDMYAKSENMVDARSIFDSMHARNIVSWNTIIVGFGRHGDGKEAMKLFQQMLDEDFNPDELTMAGIVSSCYSSSTNCELVQVHAYVIKSGLKEFLSILNALTTAYSKCGALANALQCFRLVPKPDIVTWTSLISAYAMHGLPMCSINTFEKMLSAGIWPDQIAVLGVLSACSHAGLVNEGLHYFNSMIKDYRIKPNTEHCTCLIDLLGRAGHLDDAFSVLKSLSVDNNSSTLGSFLGACKVHGDTKLAKWAASKLFEMEPDKAVNYSLMSNTYAFEGNWHNVARIRKLMRESCGHKVPGFSWIELAGSTHIFSSSDKRHSESLEIYDMLRILFPLPEEESQEHAL